MVASHERGCCLAQAFSQHTHGDGHDCCIDDGTGGSGHRQHRVFIRRCPVHHNQRILQRQDCYQRVDKIDCPELRHQNVPAGHSPLPSHVNGGHRDLPGGIDRHRNGRCQPHEYGFIQYHHHGNRPNQRQIHYQKQYGTDEECPAAIAVLLCFKPGLVSLLCEKNGASNCHEQEVKETDAPMPYRTVTKTQIPVIQGEERCDAQGSSGAQKGLTDVILPPHPKQARGPALISHRFHPWDAHRIR